jgi:hypothetical protein
LYIAVNAKIVGLAPEPSDALKMPKILAKIFAFFAQSNSSLFTNGIITLVFVKNANSFLKIGKNR